MVTFQLLMIVSIYKVVLSLQTSNGLLVERIKVMKGYFRLATLLREAKVKNLAFHFKEFSLINDDFISLMKSINLFYRFNTNMDLIAEGCLIIFCCYRLLIKVISASNCCDKRLQRVPRWVINKMSDEMEWHQLPSKCKFLRIVPQMHHSLVLFFTELLHLRDDYLKEENQPD